MQMRGWLRAVLGREGRVEEVVPGSKSESASADGKEQGQEEPLSRVQQLLGGLPVCQAPGAFATPPPVCPSVWERDKALLARYHAYVDDAEKIGWRALPDPTQEEGRALAAQCGPGRSTFPTPKPPSNVTEFTGTSRAQPSLHCSRTDRNRKPLPATGGMRNRIGDGAG